MTKRTPPRFALALLERFVPDGAVMAGDLAEEFERRPSRWRVWREVAAAIVFAWHDASGEIRPLHLVDLQPSDAAERTRRFGLRFRSPSQAPSPFAGAGGLATAILASLMTVVMPGAWWLFAISVLAGIALGVLMIAARRRSVG